MLKHDLKARLEEFCHLSGHERIHLGMTSSDIVENTYSIRIRRSILSLGPDRGRPVGGTPAAPAVSRGPRSGRERYRPAGTAGRWAGGGPTQPDVGALLRIRTAPHSGGAEPAPVHDLELATALVSLVQDPCLRVLANGYLTMLAGQEFWLEGDVATSCVRRHAWPQLFAVVEKDQP